MKPRNEKDGKAPRKPYVSPQLVAYGGLTMPILMGLVTGKASDGVPKGNSGQSFKT